MASTTAPYYATTTAIMLGNNHDNGAYPDVPQSMASDVPAYSYADKTKVSNVAAERGIASDQFAGLLEAATAAAGQETQPCQVNPEPDRMAISDRPVWTARFSKVAEEQSERTDSPPIRTGKRKRTSATHGRAQASITNDYEVASYHDSAFMRPRKRKRVSEPSESECSEATPECQMDRRQSTLEIREQPPHESLSDARAAGVHSAAALFRRPSSTGKKYTRPPMSKLFTSLELPPENFLHLQAAAKGYMLDAAHPERTDCVGQRGKGDTEMVKLRLWHCVKNFLEAGGFGEKFFGRQVPGDDGTTRTLVWPMQKNEIISALTPLLRRMVTNERQRRYALETRKGGSASISKKKKKTEVLDSSFQEQTPSRGTELGLQDHRMKLNGYIPDTDDMPQHHRECNEASRLDNLGILSGLPPEDWNGLVTAVDDHIRIFHYEARPQRSGCDRDCEEDTTNEILQTGYLDHGSWRAGVGGTREKKHSLYVDSSMPKQEPNPDPLSSAKLVIRELFPTIKATIRYKTPTESWKDIQPQHGEEERWAANTQPSETLIQTLARLLPGEATPAYLPARPVTLQINMLTDGKRCVPRFDVTADHVPDLQTLHDRITEHHTGRQFSNLRIRVLLSDGLQPVRSDNQWILALLSTQSVDWMDGELKVIVESDEA
ncbi:MAG: hypothetical protein M1830_009414 [Pleopsidium flavum]|nr:MAG: hypothetical protein M1830_009414 [Pleopsidium flavum]